MGFRVFVLGGYGQFGRFIVEALAGDAGMELVVAGRDGAGVAACGHDRYRTGVGTWANCPAAARSCLDLFTLEEFLTALPPAIRAEGR